MTSPLVTLQNPLFRYIFYTNAQLPHTNSFTPTISHGAASIALWASSQTVRRTLALLSSKEQEDVLRFYHPQDAALSLGSNLLKRLAVVRTLGIQWNDVQFSHDENGKPVVAKAALEKNEAGNMTVFEFNVSHHGALVALVGWHGHELNPKYQRRHVGIDIVKVDWKKDRIGVKRAGGWEEWVKVFEEAFNASEVLSIVNSIPDDSGDEETVGIERLRLFYAHWCLREAYIKMTGEALLAPWLKELEFKNVMIPRPCHELDLDRAMLQWGAVVENFEIWLKGSRVQNVKMELQAFGQDYMIATAVSDAGMPDDGWDGKGGKHFPEFQEISIEHDIFSAASNEPLV
ncbi:hypothetical protein MMC06_006443 [Schaereria dolodes]|nr:hypothetical protein [Schaereria dolodes]